jgi:hypothetical protein
MEELYGTINLYKYLKVLPINLRKTGLQYMF